MKPSREYIIERFSYFNSLCFADGLVMPRLELSKSRRTLGTLSYKRRRKLLSGWENYDFTLRISTLIDMEQCVVDDTLLHEMIHLYILSNNLEDSSSHGKLFRSMMKDINSRFGRNITVSHRRSEREIEADNQIREHIVCVSSLNDSETFVTVSNKSALFSLWRSLERLPGLQEQRWYYTLDPYFNRYPRSRTVKLYRVDDPSELQAALQNSSTLVKRGNQIVIE